MRIRLPFAISFLILLVLASTAGLLPHSSLPSTPSRLSPYVPPQSDKFLHLIIFFALTLTFYFILDTTRRRVLHITLFVCTLLLGVGSEVVQGLLPNDRFFDAWDVLANVMGSLCAVGLAGAYHRRSAERRRRAKYSALTGELLDGEEDLELGEGPAIGSSQVNGSVTGQESGVVSTAAPPTKQKSVEEEIDNWDENAEDEPWDEDDEGVIGGHGAKFTPATSSAGSEDVGIKKLAVD